MKYKTPDIIQRILNYLRDQLSNQERHELEKEINTNPFLQDAMDGFSRLSANELESDLFDLQKRLAQRVDRKKTRKLIPFVRIAASILLIIGLGTTVFFVAQRRMAHQQMALDSAPKETQAELNEKSISIHEMTANTQLQEQEMAPEPIIGNASPKIKKRESNPINTAGVTDHQIVEAFADEEYDFQAPTAISSDTSSTIQPADENNEEVSLNDYKLTSSGINQPAKLRVNGKIVDQEGNPIIGANVLQKGSTSGTLTDINGNFNLLVDSSSTLDIAYVGYLNKEITAIDLYKNKSPLMLSEDIVALDEVVVVGYGTQKKSNVTGSVAVISEKELINRESNNSPTPQPKGGYKKFDKYIDKNKKLDANNSMQVKLRITIASTGEISGLEVIESPEAKYSDEAIRLLKEGPVWEPAILNDQPIESTIELTISL